MNKSSIRAFGIAFFLIGASMVLIDRFGNTGAETTAQSEYEQKIAHLEQQLEDANEQIALLKQTDTQNDIKEETPVTVEEPTETEPEPKQQPELQEDTSNDVVQATLHIYSGLTPYDIGKKLEDLGIVKNGLEMELFLAKPEYAKYIQIGQFELDSSMTIEEIASIITGKN